MHHHPLDLDQADRPKPGDRRLSLRLPAEEFDLLTDLAWRERSSASALTRRALRASYSLTNASSGGVADARDNARCSPIVDVAPLAHEADGDDT